MGVSWVFLYDLLGHVYFWFSLEIWFSYVYSVRTRVLLRITNNSSRGYYCASSKRHSQFFDIYMGATPHIHIEGRNQYSKYWRLSEELDSFGNYLPLDYIPPSPTPSSPETSLIPRPQHWEPFLVISEHWWTLWTLRKCWNLLLSLFGHFGLWIYSNKVLIPPLLSFQSSHFLSVELLKPLSGETEVHLEQAFLVVMLTGAGPGLTSGRIVTAYAFSRSRVCCLPTLLSVSDQSDFLI